MSLFKKYNNLKIEHGMECLKCGSHKVIAPNWSEGVSDWQCLDCKELQLKHIKQDGFRYYAFLLSGSWTSEYVKARNINEAYRYTVKKYQGKHEVYRSYLVGGVDQFCLKNWQSF